MRILKSNFSTIDALEILLKLFYGERTIILESTLSQIFDGNFILQFLIVEAEAGRFNILLRNSARHNVLLCKVERICLGKLMSYGSVGVNHHPHFELIPDLFG
jgi:hypothetical protein